MYYPIQQLHYTELSDDRQNAIQYHHPQTEICPNISFRNELLPTFWPEYCLNPKSISTTYWHGTKMLNPKSISTTYWHGTKIRQLLKCKFCENYDAPAQNSVCQPHHMSPMYSLFQQLQYAECLRLLQSNKIWPSMDRNLFKPQWYQWTRKSEHYQRNLLNIIDGCHHWKWFKDIVSVCQPWHEILSEGKYD